MPTPQTTHIHRISTYATTYIILCIAATFAITIIAEHLFLVLATFGLYMYLRLSGKDLAYLQIMLVPLLASWVVVLMRCSGLLGDLYWAGVYWGTGAGTIWALMSSDEGEEGDT